MDDMIWPNNTKSTPKDLREDETSCGGILTEDIS
jgi:hypothetical protein